MATFVEYLSGERLTLRLLKEQGKRKLLLVDPRGRRSSLSLDKVLYRHEGSSQEHLAARLEGLGDEVDVPLLWETALEERGDGSLGPAELAQLYFDEASAAHCSAIFRALAAEGHHFRRRGTDFAPRSREELEQLRLQREAEERAAREQEELEQLLVNGEVDEALAGRLERKLRGGEDRMLTRAMDASFSDPPRSAFKLLVRGGHLPPTDSLEVLAANLHKEHPAAVVEHAGRARLPDVRGEVEQAGFSIDDEQTLEVDDVLTVRRDGLKIRVDIDIADPSSFISQGDPVDREAMRRATTIYLPTGVYYMLPEGLGCELGSLRVGEERPAMRTSVWLNEDGEVQGHELKRVTISVGERLSYRDADAMIAGQEGPCAEPLRLLNSLAAARAERRRERGALFIRRQEWKLLVGAGGEEVEVLAINPDSPSRALVAEMMILVGSLAAQEASDRDVPIIFRRQPPPTDPLPEVAPSHPAAFMLLRRHLHPASLSLSPGEHWGLGLAAYTQVSSPLRRYADLVVQRQLGAVLEGAPQPYDSQELLKVLATAEAAEKEARRLESTMKERWSMEYVRRLPEQQRLDAMVLGEHPAGGYQAQLTCCGAVGLLQDDRRHEPGEQLEVDVKTVRPEKGTLRLLPSS